MTATHDGRQDETGPASRVHCVIAYEDVKANRRAKRACQQIAQAVRPDCVWSTAWWNFTMLQVRSIRDIAAQEAAVADLMVLTAHDDVEYPRCVMEWAQVALERSSSRPKALLVLLGPPHEGSENALSYGHPLEHLAQQAQVPLCCLRPELSHSRWSEGSYPDSELVAFAQAALAAPSPACLVERGTPPDVGLRSVWDRVQETAADPFYGGIPLGCSAIENGLGSA